MVDCNNQYGWAMSQYLPTGGFKWMEEKSLDEWVELIKSQEEEQEKGYFLEVDLEYPEELHDAHDTFPCAPEHVKIEKDMLSDYQKELGEKLGVILAHAKGGLASPVCARKNPKFPPPFRPPTTSSTSLSPPKKIYFGGLTLSTFKLLF